MKSIYAIVILVILIAGGWYRYSADKRTLSGLDSATKENSQVFDARNGSFTIDGKQVTLVNGTAEGEAAPGSSSKVVTRYFGNELKTDLNADGRTDAVFLVTQEKGGSGTFYYVVGVMNTENGYIGSDGYYLGDRIAPQTINNSPNPRHKNVVVVSYADRKKDEPMTAQPSVAKSVYLKMDENNKWAIVVADFEGEAR